MSCLVLYILKKPQQTQLSDTFLKVCEPDFSCLEVHSPAPVLVQVRPILLPNSRRSEVGWKKNIAKPSSKNDTPCKQPQATLFRFSNVEMSQQCTILIIHKIKLLPHVVLNAVPHVHPPTLLPPVLCGQEECDHSTAWVGEQTYSKVSFPFWQLGEAQKAVPKSNSSALTSVPPPDGGDGFVYPCLMSRRWHRKMLGGHYCAGLHNSLNRESGLNGCVCDG